MHKGTPNRTTVVRVIAAAVSLALVAAACSSNTPDPVSGPGSNPVVDLSNNDIRLLSGLVPFEDCSELLGHIQTEATERVGPYGLDWSGSGYFFGFNEDILFSQDGEFARDVAVDAPTEEAASDDSGGFDSAGSDAVTVTTAAQGEGGEADFTGTNVQELGVDEPDIIKTDGDRIIVISENTLTYVDISGDEPEVTDQITIAEGWGHELFFEGDRALLFTNGGGWGAPEPLGAAILDDGDAEARFAEDVRGAAPIAAEWFGPAATIFELDLSDPSNLEIIATLRIQGEYLSARRVGNTVRLALSSPPAQLEWVYPSSPAGEDRAERFNRELIDETSIEDWIPEYELTTSEGTSGGPLLECDRLHRPSEFSGFDIVSVLSFSVDDGLNAGDATGVLASGRTVYASTDRFYVATSKWAGEQVVNGDFVEWDESYTTDIHAFSISTDSAADYVASGMVEGSLLNQFSMDEHEGYLRIITTDGSPWSDTDRSETKLTVLSEDGDVLTQVGQVGGIGEGETLFSARLLDDVGFAVTFRQVDPFYVLDLSDPTDPRIAGELKIPGFSTYLHPIGDDLVLGVGQDATEQGETLGLKVSLFDVSDPSDPTEVATWTMPNANSPVEYDHRAFQFLAEDRIAIVPAQTWNGEFTGAVILQIGDASITELGTVTHVPDATEPTTDCETIDAERFSSDTELFYIAQEGGHLQFCDENDNGGYGSWYCDPIGLEDLRYWGPEDVMDDIIADLAGGDPGPEDRIEICWPDGGNWQQQIQRSLVVGDVLWTMSLSQLQANDRSNFDLLDVLPF